MPSRLDKRGSDTQVAARFWDDHHSIAEDPRFWMAHPLCRATINRRVTGNPNEWPLEWFARVYGPRKVGLSLGCGIGNLERSARRIGFCESIMGVDVSPRSLEVARERAREEETQGLTYVEADLNQLKLPRGVYDVVFIHQSLHHVGSLEKLLGRVARSLKPEGVLFLDEWTGPAMTEWSPTLMARPAALFAEIPRAWRQWPEFQPPVNGDDPSEGIRSSDILPTLNLYFDSIEVRPYGGHLAALLTAELDRNVNPGPDLDGFIAKWLAMEEEDLAARSYHHVVVAKPRRGGDAARGRVIGFGGRIGLALRYRVPGAAKRVRDFLVS